MNELKKWSFSKLDCWMTCQQKFKNIYLDGQRGAIKSDPMAIGTGIHDFLEQFSLNRQLTREQFREIYLKSALGENCLVNKDEPAKFTYMIDDYLKAGKVLTPKIRHGKAMTETFFTLDCGSGVLCNGKIDIITEKDNVVDYKTSKKPYDPAEVKSILTGKGFQLSIYAAAYHMMFDKVPNKVGFQVLIKKPGSVPQNLGGTRSLNHIQETKDRIVLLDRQMRSTKKFLKTNTARWMCKFCDFKHDCGRA